MRSRVSPAVLALLIAAAGCEAFRSDSENAVRAARAERARRVAGMQAATRETARGADVAGDALTRAVSGRTHVFTYQVTPDGRRERYVESTYFRPDGRLVYRNTLWAMDPDGRDGDHWRVDGDRLCILNGGFSSDEQCYRLAVEADGRIQYYVAEPGHEADGLLTKVTDRVTDGPQAP